MELTAIELRRIALPLVGDFRTSFGTQRDRDILLVRAIGPDQEGWGECVAMADPHYSSEYVDGAHHVLRHHLAPRLLAAGARPGEGVTGEDVAGLLAGVKGHRMAKAALEAAVLDGDLRHRGISLAQHLGATRTAVDAGVSVGITDTVDELLDVVAAYLDQGYRRVKLKVEPGFDVEPVRAVRERFGDDLLLQVDANCAYTLADAEHLAGLDPFDLLLIEQPLPEEDLAGHAALARRIATPVCLDESIESVAHAALALDLGAAAIINIKPGRVGGYLEAVRIHDLCQARGVPVWCGGMLETGIGRAANVALAALPGFTLPGDTSASDRYWTTDVTEPFVLVDGRLAVPDGPGIGRAPRLDVLAAVTTSVETLTRP